MEDVDIGSCRNASRCAGSLDPRSKFTTATAGDLPLDERNAPLESPATEGATLGRYAMQIGKGRAAVVRFFPGPRDRETTWIAKSGLHAARPRRRSAAGTGIDPIMFQA